MNKVFPKSFLPIIIFAFFIGLLLSGCWNPFIPPESQVDESSDESLFLPHSTPQNVLHNLKVAYENREIDAYRACLSDSFQFHPLEEDRIDVNNDGIPDEYWGKDTEDRFTQELFAIFHNITLDYLDTLKIEKVDDNHQIIEIGFNLSVRDQSGTFGFDAHGYQLFTFRKESNGLWRIVRWIDESNSPGSI